jgi:integrase
MQKKTPIIKMGTRILRPSEFDELKSACPKPDYKIMLQALLYTGMRYVEMQRLYENPSWFDDDTIRLPRTAMKKSKRKQLDRDVRLNMQGRIIVEQFLNLRYGLPSIQAWGQNMKRWAKYAGIDPAKLSAKTTRKTWESWLVNYYPTQSIAIAASQGHTTVTQFEHYINMSFDEVDKLQMKKYIGGWI